MCGCDSILKLNQIEIGYGISKGKLSCGTLYRGYVAGALTGGVIGAYMPIKKMRGCCSRHYDIDYVSCHEQQCL